MHRKILCGGITLLLVCLLAGAASAGTVRISQIYANGGANTRPLSPYNADYVELFNSGPLPIDIGGWLLAYAGSTTTSSYGCPDCTQAFPEGTTIDTCGYLLVRVGPVSSTMGAPVPAPDVVLSAPDLASSGSLMLLRSGTPVGLCPTGPELEDLVGWGGVSCREGSSAPFIVVREDQALHRLGDGFLDTNDNAADFYLGPAGPRSSASPPNPTCISTEAVRTSWGRVKAIHR